jgi:hypothetical protein
MMYKSANQRAVFLNLHRYIQGATHLNGRAGVVHAFHATDQSRFDPSRFLVRLDDGKEVSVKAGNVEHIRGEIYRRRTP